MLISAARALAAVVSDEELNASYIVPSVFHPDASSAVAAAVSRSVRISDRVLDPEAEQQTHADLSDLSDLVDEVGRTGAEPR
jgi:malic enzyme